MYTDIISQTWNFPYNLPDSNRTLAWRKLHSQFSWLQAMDGVPQNPEYHAEGDVLIHTRMVAEALIGSTAWRALGVQEQTRLVASALLHDVGKPSCTKFDETGRLTSRGHARKGEYITRSELITSTEFSHLPDIFTREYIAKLVRFHGLPLQFIDQRQPEKLLFAASQSVRLEHVALLAEADVYGRICADQQELLTRVELFRLFCQEQACYEQPRAFANAHSRFLYFQNEQRDPDYAAYDDTKFEVIMLAGLPGAGKDSWIQQHAADWPVVSLDEIRRELKISAEYDQGHVVQIARERARALMRKYTSFVWNATNVTRMLRRQLIDLFAAYGARIRLVYIEAPFAVLQQRNREREADIPEHVLSKLLHKLDVPDHTEAHSVEWVVTM